MCDLVQPLLSICIPTYNHISTLKECLFRLLEARKEFDEDVEIIVSDNCSSDDTIDFLRELQSENKNFRYFRNERNLGFNGNIELLITKYAQGKYVWTIGDDDYVSVEVLKFFFENYDNADLILLKHNIISSDENNLECKLQRSMKSRMMTYIEAIDNIATASNLMATFMSCAIFLKEKYKENILLGLKPNDWKNFKYVFPNGYVLAESFCDSKNVICSEDFFIFVNPHEKEWDDKLTKITVKILPDFYVYLIKKQNNIGYKLKKTREIIFLSNISVLRQRKLPLYYFSNMIRFFCIAPFVRKIKGS